MRERGLRPGALGEFPRKVCRLHSPVPLQVCDGSPDCSDRSDEAGCSPAPACSREREFQCSGGGCIRAEWRCDGEVGCWSYCVINKSAAGRLR